MKKRALLGSAIATAAAFVACTGDDPAPITTVFVDAGPGSSSGATGSSSSGADSGPVTDCPIDCLPKPPAGWKGPSAVYDAPNADAFPDCGGSYAASEVDGYVYGKTDDQPCTCEASTVQSPRCEGTYITYEQTACANVKSTPSIETGACISGAAFPSFEVKKPGIAGTCRASSATPGTPPAINVQRGMRACGLTASAACAGYESCTAAPFSLPPKFSRLCIHKAGEEACPNADYPVPVLIHKDRTDTRHCDPCKTALPADGCTATFDIFSDDQCNTKDTTVPGTTGQCYPVANSGLHPAAAGSWALPKPTNTNCTTTPQPAGAVTPTLPEMFCCNK